jgi:hypothetical protein
MADDDIDSLLEQGLRAAVAEVRDLCATSSESAGSALSNHITFVAFFALIEAGEWHQDGPCPTVADQRQSCPVAVQEPFTLPLGLSLTTEAVFFLSPAPLAVSLSLSLSVFAAARVVSSVEISLAVPRLAAPPLRSPQSKPQPRKREQPSLAPP